MKQFPFLIFGLLLFAVACKNDPKTPEVPATPVAIEKSTFGKSAGTDCDKVDSLQLDCVSITMAWPTVVADHDGLKQGVNAWTYAYLASILSPEPIKGVATPSTVETAAGQFVDEHADFVKEGGESMMGVWTAEVDGDVLLNNGKHLTLNLGGYVYAGGAHGSPTAAIATFEVATGKQLMWDDLVTDQAAVKALAEKKIRVERADVFKEGFNFDDTFNFTLPVAYGLVADGIQLHYQHYEIMPYALGASTFTLTFEELGALAKIGK